MQHNGPHAMDAAVPKEEASSPPFSPITPTRPTFSPLTPHFPPAPQQQPPPAQRQQAPPQQEQEQARQPRHEILSSLADVDLNSSLANNTPAFTFPPPARHPFPLSAYHVHAPLAVCLMLKRWLLNEFKKPENAAPGILRMECQDLHLIPLRSPRQREKGTLVLLDNAVFIQHGEARVAVSVLALFMPHDSKVRWFYCATSSFAPALLELAQKDMVTLRGELRPWKTKNRNENGEKEMERYARLYTFLSQEFSNAIKKPEHADFLAAQLLGDYSLDIAEAEEGQALKKLLEDEVLYPEASRHIPANFLAHPPATHNRKKQKEEEEEGINPSTDRYLLHLCPAEREIAIGILRIPCSKYLLVKRQFFQDFWREIVKRSERVGNRRMRVRTEVQHEGWFEECLGWKARGAGDRKYVSFLLSSLLVRVTDFWLLLWLGLVWVWSLELGFWNLEFGVYKACHVPRADDSCVCLGRGRAKASAYSVPGGT